MRIKIYAQNIRTLKCMRRIYTHKSVCAEYIAHKNLCEEYTRIQCMRTIYAHKNLCTEYTRIKIYAQNICA